MHLVETMTQAPQRCMICGKGNTDRETGVPDQYIDLERDYNWGDAAYICSADAERIGALAGMASPEDVTDLKRENEVLEKRLHNERAKAELSHKRMKEELIHYKQIVEGSKALKREKQKVKVA